MKIQKVTDPAFRKYGQVLEGYDFTGLIKEMKHTPVPEDVIYVPSVEELEALDIMKDLQNKGYGGLPIQIGYCNGHNKKLNAVEYHRNSEINVAVTDLVLLIGHQQDIEPDHTRPSLSKPADQITLLDIYKAVEGEKPLLHLDTHTNPDCGVGINIQLSLQGFYNEIQKNTEEKMNTITLQDIINTYYQRTSMQNDLQNII